MMHLKNPWNDNKPVKISRDGQVERREWTMTSQEMIGLSSCSGSGANNW